MLPLGFLLLAQDVPMVKRPTVNMLDWAERLDSATLAGELTWYSGAMKAQLHQPKWLLVTHMFNHQTHHRGQVHCMLTQAGGKPSDTDLPFMPM